MNTENPSSPSIPLLVIGWGSELRGDDAVGLVFARKLEAQAHPGLEVIEVPQLTPELAWDVSRARRVVFADAVAPGTVEGIGEMPVLRKLEVCESIPARFIPTCVHSLSPDRILELSAALYESRPEAWVLYLPAFDFNLGLEISSRAEQGVEEGLQILRPLLNLPEPAADPVEGLHPAPLIP